MADPTKDPIKEAEENRAAKDAAEAAALSALQKEELSGLQKYNKEQYTNQGQILNDIYSKINVAKAKDETAQKRENAYRYISGVGDTLSSLANLVGTAHGAANQQQTYNSSAVVEKAEEARKARKLEMEDLAKRQDEMRAQLRELKAAGSLAESQLNVQHAKEKMELESKQRTDAIEAAYKARENWLKEEQLKVDQQNAESARVRAEAYEYGQENPKPTSTGKPPKKHPFEIVGGKMIEIPDNLWTNTAITSVYDLIPMEERTRRSRKVKNAAGKDVDEKDASGNVVYHTATQQEMLNDIVRLAKTNENVAKALENLSKGGANSDKYE